MTIYGITRVFHRLQCGRKCYKRKKQSWEAVKILSGTRDRRTTQLLLYDYDKLVGRFKRKSQVRRCNLEPVALVNLLSYRIIFHLHNYNQMRKMLGGNVIILQPNMGCMSCDQRSLNGRTRI